MDYVKAFNRYAAEKKTLIQKALTSATNVGAGFIPEKLEELITNTVVRLSPELAIITPKFDNQKTHSFNRTTALPAAGGAMGEGATTPTRNSTTARATVELKIVRRKGAVTNFLQDAAKKYIDVAAQEMETHLQAHVYDMATYLLYGNAGADTYTFSGLDRFVATNRTNLAQGGSVPTNLTFLDNLIDANANRQGAPHRKCFVMSNEMLSKISSLLTNVRVNQGLSGGGLTTVEINGGWRLAAYRDVPIVPTSACRPTGTMGTVTSTPGGTGSGFGANTYYIRVAPVTWGGEQLASAEVTQVITNQDTVTLSFTAYTGALFYKIYLSTSAGATKLIKVVSAFTYDADGTPTGNNTSIALTTPSADETSVPTHMQNDVPLVATGGIAPEYIFFWDLDEIQGMGKLPYTNTGGTRFNGLVTMKPLAETDDNLPFLIKSYCALCDSFEATSSIVRGYRTE